MLSARRAVVVFLKQGRGGSPARRAAFLFTAAACYSGRTPERALTQLATKLLERARNKCLGLSDFCLTPMGYLLDLPPEPLTGPGWHEWSSLQEAGRHLRYLAEGPQVVVGDVAARLVEPRGDLALGLREPRIGDMLRAGVLDHVVG